MEEPKVIEAHADVSAVMTLSATGTVVSSGTAIVPAEGPQGVMQTVVVPKLEIVPERFQRDFSKITALVEQAALHTGAPDKPGFYVDEVEVRLDVTAEGGLRLLGSGVDASATAGVRVVFRRGKPSED